MKLDARQAAGLLNDPGRFRLVLLYGDDESLIRERSKMLTRSVTGGLNDAFCVTELTREGWGRIAAEVASLSLLGGRRVVAVRDATDAALSTIADAMKGPGDALLIVEAFGLGKGRLRSFAEAASNFAALGCYAGEGRAVSHAIAEACLDMKVRVDQEALGWLGQVLGGEYGAVRGAAEKLALLAGPDGCVSLEMAQSCIDRAGAAAIDDALLAATLGDVILADAAVETALSEGLAGVAVVRTATLHLQKMHQARLRMAQGVGVSDAVRGIRPPVFYRAASMMTDAVQLWSLDNLIRALEEARRVELACKQTASRPELLARRLIQFISRLAKAQRAAWV